MKTEARAGTVGGIAGEQLRAIIDRVERLHEERKAIAEDIKAIYAETKGNGWDTKVIQHIVKIRSKDSDAMSEFEALVEAYMRSIGMLPADDADDREAA